MDFTINRTSNDWDKPCKGAYQDVIHRNYQGNRIDVWKIKISSLEELVKLMRKYGPIIIEPNDDNEEWVNLEIYDDYRE